MGLEKLVPTGLLLAFCGKALILGFSTGDVVAVVALIAFVFGMDYLSKQKSIQAIKEKAEQDFQSIADVVKKQNEVIEAMAKEVDMVRTSVVGVKLNAGYKKLG